MKGSQVYLTMGPDKKNPGELRTLCKNLIYIFFTMVLCGCVALGFSMAHAYLDKSCQDSSNSTSAFNAMNPTKLDYVWPENVEKLIHNIVDNNMHVTNDDRAVLLKTELMRFKTSDVFYIMVYNGASGPMNHAFHGDKDEYITVFKPEKCNVVVFRSHFWRSSPYSAFNVIEREVKDTCRKGIMESTDYSKVPQELQKNFHDTNFIGLIGKDLEVSIRSANSFGRVWGPGYWDTVEVLDGDSKNPTGKEFILIAGYK